MAGPFDDLIPQQPTQQTPGRIYGAPDPLAGLERAREEAALEGQRLTNEERARNLQKPVEPGQGGGNFKDESSLRTEFSGLPSVKNFETILPLYASAIRAGEGGAGDVNIIYALAKAMDPGSVVREGELQIASSTGSAGERLKGYFKQVRTGGSLTPEVRQGLLNEMRNRASAAADAYNQQRSRYGKLAQRYNIDPEVIIGPHPGAPFQQAEANFLGRPVVNRDGSQGAAPSVVPDGVEGGDVQRTDDGRLRVNIDVPTGDAGFLEDLRGAAQNTIAGIGQGLAAIPDAATQALGATLALPADALGFEGVANNLRNPITIGGLIERAVPTPNNPVDQGVRFASQLAGGVAGFPNRAANALTEAVVGRVPARPAINALSPAASTAQAAERQGVELLPADVGGRNIQAMTSAAAQGPVSAGSISGVSRRAADQMGAAANRAASQAGRVLPEDEAGEIARKGGNKFIKEVTQRASRQYERANELAAGVKIMPANAIRAIDDAIAKKSQAGEMSSDIVSELQKVKRSLEQAGGMSVVGMREARTILGAMVRNDKLRGTDAKRIFGEVLDAASKDMESALVAAGKEGAARLFRRADTLWRERIAEIDEVLEPIIGKAKSGEDIVKAVEQMARGNRGGVARLGRMLSALPANEKGDVVATVIDRMGRATASGQDDVGQVFSSETFLTNWNKMSPKGKAALFGSGELRRNLDDIAKIASARRDTASLGSRSNTPVGIMANVGTIGATGVANPVAPFVLLAAQYGAGRLLASPAFVRWLARTPRAPGALKGHVARLSAVAEANPAIAGEIAGVQRTLMQAANNNAPQMGRIAAGSPSQGPSDPNQ